jgi:hypothetical protein
LPQPHTASSRSPSDATHTVDRNGYRFAIDAEGRTREVTGPLKLGQLASRSRTEQGAQAPPIDWRPTTEAITSPRASTDQGKPSIILPRTGTSTAARTSSSRMIGRGISAKAILSRLISYQSIQVDPRALTRSRLNGKLAMRRNGSVLPIDRKENDLVEQALSEKARRLAAIAAESVHLAGGTTFPLRVHIEAGDGWVSESIYREGPDVVEYVNYSPEAGSPLFELIMDAWDAEDPDKRWAEAELEITDGNFTTRFRYPDEIEPMEDAGSMARRDTAIAARFGDKPVKYPA